jgi:hypothetical protein
MPRRGSGIDSELLQAALVGLERKREELAEQIARVRQMLGGRASSTDSAGPDMTAAPARKRRRFSPATRRRMAEAQRARWAAAKGAASPVPAKKSAAPKKRRISAASRKAMSEATKKRWAEYRTKKTGGNTTAATKSAGA